jgi:SAM-dependent MidA family methyltransferase
METVIEPRMTFEQFMEQALYGPDGYYTSGRARSGREGDYFTAPDVSAVFGRLLARIFQDWQIKLSLKSFQIVEVGAGEGALAKSIAAELPNIHYAAVERSPSRRKILSEFVQAYPDLVELPSFSGCIFGNELLDAFPVHRVRNHKGQLEEGYVEQGNVVWGPVSTSRLAAYLKRIQIELPEGYQTEINLAMAGWFRAAAQKLNQGLILLIDYGRPAQEYYDPYRDRGTLRTFSGHRVGSDMLSAPGHIDLTADVDFTSAALDARDAGLTPLAFMEMGSFLLEGAKSLSVAPRGLKYLIHPEGMGGQFHVLVLGKNIQLTDVDFPNNRIKRLGL